MRYLTVAQVLDLYRQIMRQTGGAMGILSMAALESALAQPQMTFAGQDLYPTIVEKAAVLGYGLVGNHPFGDGNKRTGHAAMEVFLVMNGLEIVASVDEQERIILGVAAGQITREEFTDWLTAHVLDLQ
jgi:death on curing protein